MVLLLDIDGAPVDATGTNCITAGDTTLIFSVLIIDDRACGEFTLHA